MRRSCLLVIVCSLIQYLVIPASIGRAEQTPDSLLLFTSREISATLDSVDREAELSAAALSASTAEAEPVRTALKKIYSLSPAILSVLFIDEKGAIVLAEPDSFKNLVGTSVADRESVRGALKGKPLFSTIFRTAEGVYVADLEHPVMTKDAKVKGTISALIRPDTLFPRVGDQGPGGKRLELWSIQPDGCIIYSIDKYDIGRMLFSDPEYRAFEDFLLLCRKITDKRSGSGSFKLSAENGNKTAEKDVIWTSVGLHGSEWRIAVSNLAD